MNFLELVFLWKTGGSGNDGCPALYKVEGGYVVQGIKLDNDTRARLRQLADDEDGVFVPSDVLDRLKEQ
ncbi:lipid A biosynthesis lauroyl acyltransferase [Stackebrandtia soli]|uniref:lipid A biosynthesis lauroyl acyltransferase n=1 Tax=Stackebrandtia soli TaxID=1892856 RepID=UPI0039EBD080